jgi:hypothetical protein
MRRGDTLPPEFGAPGVEALPVRSERAICAFRHESVSPDFVGGPGMGKGRAIGSPLHHAPPSRRLRDQPARGRRQAMGHAICPTG